MWVGLSAKERARVFVIPFHCVCAFALHVLLPPPPTLQLRVFFLHVCLPLWFIAGKNLILSLFWDGIFASPYEQEKRETRARARARVKIRAKVKVKQACVTRAKGEVAKLCSRVYESTKSHTCHCHIADAATTHQRVMQSNVQMNVKKRRKNNNNTEIPEILQTWTCPNVNKHQIFGIYFFAASSCVWKC